MFPDELKRYRLQNGMTQERAATALGITRVSYTRYELGTQAPHIRLLPAIAKLFGCRIDDLFTQEELEGKASAQTLLPEAHSEGHPGGDTPPWADDDDLTGILE